MNNGSFSENNPIYKNKQRQIVIEEIKNKIMTLQKDFDSGLTTFIRYCKYYDFFDTRYINKNDYFTVLLMLGLITKDMNMTFPNHIAKIKRYELLYSEFKCNKYGFFNYHEMGKAIFNTPPY